jgi:hypothetical protein
MVFPSASAELAHEALPPLMTQADAVHSAEMDFPSALTALTALTEKRRHWLTYLSRSERQV